MAKITKEALENFTKAVDAMVEERADEKRELIAVKNHLSDLQKIIFEFGWVELQRGGPVRLVEDEDADI